MTTKAKRTFIKLGYSHLDTAEIVTLQNRLLAGYAIYQQKLKNFYWNVEGQDFFELHNLFGQMYQHAIVESDEIAERIRLFGQRPASTFSEYLKLSFIKEVHTEPTSFEMVKIIIADIRSLLENMEEGIGVAQDINDNGTEHMLKGFVYKKEKEHWLLSAWLKQKV